MVAVAVLPVALFVARLVVETGLVVAARRLGLGFGGFGFGLLIEIDVEAGRERVALQEFRHRPLRLHLADHAEVVLRMLQVVFGQDAVAGRIGVAGQLLVFFVDGLGVAAHLGAFGSVRLVGPVGVVLIARGFAVAVALPLHAPEIFHDLELLLLVTVRPQTCRAVNLP